MFSVPALSTKNLFVALLLLGLPFFAQAQNVRTTTPGLAWEVTGAWRVEGSASPLRSGDTVPPGSLLSPAAVAGEHSVTILLPDGQRILYECFTVEDCARGFRVPPLYTRPQPFAVEMLARIHSALAAPSGGSQSSLDSSFAHQEAVAVLDAAKQVHVSGLVASLPPGNYRYDLRPVYPVQPRQFHILLKKVKPSVTLTLPGPGLYIVKITDDSASPRVDLFLAAIQPAQAPHFQSFRTARALIEQWNDDYQGWPTHEFARAYLQSLMPGAHSLPVAAREVSSLAQVRDQTPAALDVTPEPSFFPSAGVFNGDTAVTLRCSVQQAAIHYTVDGSQPVASSPVYSAPILVKGTELTIKAYAAVAGKKESAVVTGIFRIRQASQ